MDFTDLNLTAYSGSSILGNFFRRGICIFPRSR